MIQVALLRGVNVGGHRPIAMSELRAFLLELKLEDPQTLLQSGNLVFRSPRRTGPDLERFLEAEAEKRLGLRTTIHVRTAREWQALIGGNPFAAEAKDDPGHLVAMLLRTAPDRKSVHALQAAIVGPEKVRTGDRHAYFVYPAGIGASRLSAALIEKHLGPGGTARNWRTVLKLGLLAGVGEGAGGF